MREPKYKVFVEYTGRTELVTGLSFNVMGKVNRIHTGHTEHVVRGDRDKFHLREFTGLNDKNGVEIYEGDVLYFVPYETHINDRVVKFKQGQFVGEMIRSKHIKPLKDVVGGVEVVGNIYENTYLLKQ